MENRLRELTIEQLIPLNIPEDVKQVDILYKESDSPNVYLVDEIKPSDQYWINDSYTIKQDTIKSVLPSNQLLRPWDNVPTRALAQEITMLAKMLMIILELILACLYKVEIVVILNLLSL